MNKFFKKLFEGEKPKKETGPGAMDDDAVARLKKRKEMLRKLTEPAPIKKVGN
jgi:hypothetical protein